MGIFMNKTKDKKWQPQIVNIEGLQLLRLGSDYGGWFLVHDESLFGTTMISAGLGEDASFDVEFANAYNAKILLVDPTPRAIEHFQRIQERIPQSSSVDYVNGGKQPIDSYDTEFLSKASFILEPSALWKKSKELEFYAPPNKEHVSHSIVDYQNEYRKDGEKITVKSLTFTDLLKKHQFIHDPKILKLDIEGAEIELIDHLLSKGHRPKQILVEYDELSTKKKTGLKRVMRTHRLLRKKGYSLVFFEKQNFTYYLSLNPVDNSVLNG